MSNITEGSIAEKLKAAGMKDYDRIFYMHHGYHNIDDAASRSLIPGDNLFYATGGKLHKARVTGAVWESENKRFRLTIMTAHNRTMNIDPKRCVKV